MSYCYDFIKKFRKEGNFCGLDKSEVSRLESYIEIIEMLMKQHRDLGEKQIIDNFPLGAARHLIPIKDERRATGLDYVAHQLTAGKHISGKDIQLKLEISNKKPESKPQKAKEPEKEVLENPTKEPTPAPIPAKKKPSDAFCYQRGEAPKASNDPVFSLGEKERAKELQRAGQNQPAPAPVEPQLPPPLPPDASMAEKLRRDEAVLAFNKASDYDPATGGRLIKAPAGIRIVPTPMTDEERAAWADAGVNRGGFFTKKEVEQIDELVKVHYEGIKSRADFFWRAASWFLAQAEGE